MLVKLTMICSRLRVGTIGRTGRTRSALTFMWVYMAGAGGMSCFEGVRSRSLSVPELGN